MTDSRLASIKIADCEFSVRTTNCLTASGFVTLADVADKPFDELKAIKGFGRKSFNELREVIAEFKTWKPETPQELRERYQIGLFEAAKILQGEALLRRLDQGDVETVLRQIIKDHYPRRPNV